MTTKTTKPMVFTTKNARSRQAKSAESRKRKNEALRKRFADLLGPTGLLDAFSLLLATARPSDLKRSWAFGSGQSVWIADSERASMKTMGVQFEGDADVDVTIDLPAPGEIDRMLAELDHLPG